MSDRRSYLPELTKSRLLMASLLVEEQEKLALILDVRPAESFAALHIRGAIQIGLGGPFSSWAAMLLKPKQTIVVVADNEGSAEEANIPNERNAPARPESSPLLITHK
jgi:rhodanese-related sulfurtransferase